MLLCSHLFLSVPLFFCSSPFPASRHDAGDIKMRHVTGKGARVPGPNPNASYSLRYRPPSDFQERDTSFAITGAHLNKTWYAYCSRVQGGPPPVWDPDFVSSASYMHFATNEQGCLVYAVVCSRVCAILALCSCVREPWR